MQWLYPRQGPDTADPVIGNPISPSGCAGSDSCHTLRRTRVQVVEGVTAELDFAAEPSTVSLLHDEVDFELAIALSEWEDASVDRLGVHLHVSCD